MISKNWILALYNIKREFNDYNDLQNFISVSDKIENAMPEE